MSGPERIQLSRAKGWRMPAGAVKVDRSTKFGNPFDWAEAQAEWGGTADEARTAVVGIFRDWLTMNEPERFSAALRPARVAVLAAIPDLRGKTLACWCRADQSCHGDVLLELANR